MQELVFSPSDFVAVLNQTMEYAYPLVTIEGELANVRVSRGKWVYLDIKDDGASIKCFGTVYMLPGPIEEGMMVRIVASPRLHPLYNFSLNLQSVVAIGEGSLKRASDLLLQKLTLEGLFDPDRKRILPFAPETVGLITSGESAAYADFIKILNERWCGVQVQHCDVLVQGDKAVADIVGAIKAFNEMANPPEVLVITRGGGSVDDLAAFSSEQVVRAVAGSRVPTMVAIGHEIDTSLAELAADKKASTPSNAAELIFPDRQAILLALSAANSALSNILKADLKAQTVYLQGVSLELKRLVEGAWVSATERLRNSIGLMEVLNPQAVLTRGYAVVRVGPLVIKSTKLLKGGDKITLQLQDGMLDATIDL